MSLNSQTNFSLGLHLHKAGHKSYTAALLALIKEFPMLTDVQMFVCGPQNTRCNVIDPEFVATARAKKIDINVHGSYMALPWKSTALFNHSLQNLRAAHAIGAANVIFHIPYKPLEEWFPSVEALAAQAEEEKLGPMIVLETAATIRHPTMSYESPEKLNILADAISAADLRGRVGICVDTAHIFASKVDIRTYEAAQKYCKKLPAGAIAEIQLNGNSIVPGDKTTRDEHEIPLSDADLIWRGLSYRESGCRAFIEYGAALNIPIVIEWKSRHGPAQVHEFLRKMRA